MDYNGDGTLDVLTGSILGRVYVYVRGSDRAFLEPQALQQRTRGLFGMRRAEINAGRSSSVAMADWFGCGKFDLLVGTGDGQVWLFRNEGTRQQPRFEKGTRLTAINEPISAEGGNAAPCVADWDKDGKLDLLLGCGSGQVILYLNVGSQTNPALTAGITLVDPVVDYRPSDRAATLTPKRSGKDAKVCVSDWDSDGLSDLIVGDDWPGAIRLRGSVWVYLRGPPGKPVDEVRVKRE